MEYVYPLSIKEQDSIYPFLEKITVEYNLLIKTISKLGNQLTLEYLKENDKPTGNIAGFYPPDFEAKMIDNSTFKLDTYKGNSVLIDFWGTCCAPCIKAIPELKELHSQLSKNEEFKLVSVAFDFNIEK